MSRNDLSVLAQVGKWKEKQEKLLVAEQGVSHLHVQVWGHQSLLVLGSPWAGGEEPNPFLGQYSRLCHPQLGPAEPAVPPAPPWYFLPVISWRGCARTAPGMRSPCRPRTPQPAAVPGPSRLPRRAPGLEGRGVTTSAASRRHKPPPVTAAAGCCGKSVGCFLFIGPTKIASGCVLVV